MSHNTGPIGFEILGRSFVAPASTTPSGKLSWKFPTGEESTSGIELDRWSDSLPSKLRVDDKEYDFGRVPRRGAARSDKPAGFKPYNKAREVRAKASFGEHQIEIHCRVTARKEGKWYLWFRANPIRGSAVRPSSGNQDDAEQTSDEELARKLFSGE